MSMPPEQMPDAPETSADDRNIATLTHLSGFLFSILVPLIVWLVHKDRADKGYLVREAKVALNFQLTVLIGYVVCWVLTLIVIGVLLGWLLWLANLVICIIAATRVSAEGSYRYPFTLNLVN